MEKGFVRNLIFILSLSSLFFSFGMVNYNTVKHKVDKLKRERKLVSFHPEGLKSNNVKVKEKRIISLGKKLFLDNILSRNKNVSCASCHLETQGFSNGETFGIGTHGNKTKRNVPHLYNMEMNMTFFWDGRATSLEEQLGNVITSKDELDMNYPEIIERLTKNEEYKSIFDSLFPGIGVSRSTFIQAMVAYEKTIKSYNSPFDRYLDGDSNALTSNQKKGLELFISKANCIACHKGANLTDGQFHNVGVKTDDIGRSLIDKIGMSNEFESTPYPFFSTFKAFKTPSLRNVESSAPYFHDGSKKTLREVVESYSKGGENPDPTGLAKEIKPLNLEEDEIIALVDFLQSFSSDQNYTLNQ